MNRPWIIRVGDWLSAGLNVIVFDGDSDESTSGRSYRRGVLEGSPYWYRAMLVIDWLLSWYERDHCRKAYLLDLNRAKWRLVAAKIR